MSVVQGTFANEREDVMTIGTSLVVVVVGLLIAALLSPMIGMIIAAIGLVGLVLSLVNGSRTGRTL